MPANDPGEALRRLTPLAEIPRHFEAIRQTSFFQELIATILRHCPPGSRTLELMAGGNGNGAIALASHGLAAGAQEADPLDEATDLLRALFKSG